MVALVILYQTCCLKYFLPGDPEHARKLDEQFITRPSTTGDNAGNLASGDADLGQQYSRLVVDNYKLLCYYKRVFETIVITTWSKR